MKLLEPLKTLPLGYYRLIIVGWIVLPLVIAGIVAAMGSSYDEESNFFGTLIWCIPIYYLLARFGIWIYDGFQRQQK